MPRQARVDAHDALNHTMIRGIEGREIFRSNGERWKQGAFFVFGQLRNWVSLRELAKRLEMSSSGVGYSVERGGTIARENRYPLFDKFFNFFSSLPIYDRPSPVGTRL